MDSFDLSSNDACNWMKFVRFSLNGLANLRVIRRDNQLFFNAKQSIAKDAELIVCFGAKQSTDVGLFTDLIWHVWLKTLEESVVDQLERDFSYVHLGMHVHVVREILKQTGLPLEVFQTRVLQIDHTGSMFVRRLVQSEMNPATWPRLDVYMKMVLDRLIKWIDLPVGIRTTVLTSAQDVFPTKTTLSNPASIFLFLPLMLMPKIPLRQDQPHFRVTNPIESTDANAAVPGPILSQIVALTEELEVQSATLSEKLSVAKGPIPPAPDRVLSSSTIPFLIPLLTNVPLIQEQPSVTVGNPSEMANPDGEMVTCDSALAQISSPNEKRLKQPVEASIGPLPVSGGPVESSLGKWLELVLTYGFTKTTVCDLLACKFCGLNLVTQGSVAVFGLKHLSEQHPEQYRLFQEDPSLEAVVALVDPARSEVFREMKVPPGNQPVKIVTTTHKRLPRRGNGSLLLAFAYVNVRISKAVVRSANCRFCGLTLSRPGSVTSGFRPLRNHLREYHRKQYNLYLSDPHQVPPPGATTTVPADCVMQENVQRTRLDWGRKAAHLLAFGFEHEDRVDGQLRSAHCKFCGLRVAPVTSEDVWCFRSHLKIHPEQHGAYIKFKKYAEMAPEPQQMQNHYDCRFCDSSFPTEISLQYHRELNHPDKPLCYVESTAIPGVVNNGFTKVEMIDGIRYGDCRFCGKTVTVKQSAKFAEGFRQHFQRLHPDQYNFYRYDRGQLTTSEPSKFFGREVDANPEDIEMGEFGPIIRTVDDPISEKADVDPLTTGETLETPNAHQRDQHLFQEGERVVVAPVVVVHQRSYLCEQCNLEFPSYAKSLAHNRIVHRENSPLNYRHSAIQTDGLSQSVEKASLQCSICKESCKNLLALKRHRIIVHRENSPLNYCPICREMCSNVEALHAHTATHFVEGKLPCSRCRKAFDTLHTFVIHLRYHERMDEHRRGPIPCETCGMQFTYLRQAQRHALTVHGGPSSVAKSRRRKQPSRAENPGIYKCKHCHFLFHKFATRQRHHWLHHHDLPDEEAPVEETCRFCGKTFSRAGKRTGQQLLEEHMQGTHGIGEGGGNKYCARCGRWFPRRQALQRHFDRRHDGQQAAYRNAEDNSMKRFCCFCRGVFHNAAVLLRHQRNDHAKELDGAEGAFSLG
ncbi:hypothetical protein BV898_19475 [Hypsibius exemplaris]|uniref:C2H2-type domain-containing protein n=1 Tax=Hypsibius exemplaris TaxID=2072580 RepID=A0A9X6NJB5_HYPEX|nr:hypothetical protein BV898_19475 [Hypsibius exemplaris]